MNAPTIAVDNNNSELRECHAQASVRNEKWRSPLFIRLSVFVHAGSAVVYLIYPTLWPWLLAVLIGNHLMVMSAVLCPRGRLLGGNWNRLPLPAVQRGEISLTFDDGPDPEVTPRVLDLLDRYHVKASFFCVGKKVAACPALVREIVRRGHTVENHSYHHSLVFSLYGGSRLKQEVESTQSVIAHVTGQRPRFFRAPAGFRGPWLDGVLEKRGLQYVSWTRRGFDTVRRDPKRILRQLAGPLAAGDILLLHDSGRGQTADGQPIVISVLTDLLNEIAAKALKPVPLPVAFEAAPLPKRSGLRQRLP